MNVLGIETSTEVCGAALVNDTGVNVERSVVEAHIHSEKLLTLVQNVLGEARIGVKDIDAVAVSIGPGSFTGLRIGLSSAKGLCYALEKPLLTVPTFDAIAQHAQMVGPSFANLAIALDAKRGDYYFAAYGFQNERYRIEGEVVVVSEEQVVQKLRSLGHSLIITDRKAELAPLIDGAVQFGNLTDYCRASSVATLGLKKYLAKEFADGFSVEPMYLKDFLVRTETITPAQEQRDVPHLRIPLLRDSKSGTKNAQSPIEQRQ